MVNVVVPVIERPQEFFDSVKAICTESNVRIIVGVTNSMAKICNFNLPNVTVKVFKDGCKREEILNSLQPCLDGDSVFIARKPFTKEEFKKFTSTGAQIVLCEKKRGLVAKYLYMLWSLIVKLIFGVKFFEGDTSLIYFNNDIGQVLRRVTNLSYSTRVDRWKGVSQACIPISSPPARVEGDVNINTILVLCALLSISVAALVDVLVALFTKVNVLITIMLVCVDLLCLVIALLLIFAFAFNVKVGRKNYLQAVEDLSYINK